MSEAWKNRLWQLVLVCTFAVVLSVCQKAVNSSSDESGSSGTAFTDGSTVTISSQSLPSISSLMVCHKHEFSSRVDKFIKCDSTDSTSIDSSDSYSITLANLVTAGFQPCFIQTSGTYNSYSGGGGTYMFCK